MAGKSEQVKVELIAGPVMRAALDVIDLANELIPELHDAQRAAELCARTNALNDACQQLLHKRIDTQAGAVTLAAPAEVRPTPAEAANSAGGGGPGKMVRFEFPGLMGARSHCDLELITLQDGRTAIIATERPDNPGTSITNAAEILATLVCRGYFIDPKKLTWIEHYLKKDTYDLVKFDVGPRVSLLHPRWRPMRAEDWRGLGIPQRGKEPAKAPPLSPAAPPEIPEMTDADR